MPREQIEFDVVFVGGGPACLAGAIRLTQLARAAGTELEVALIDKGREIGAHALSGAVMDTSVLAQLIPDFRETGCPIETTVRGDGLFYLNEGNAWRLPRVPRPMQNHGHAIVSQSRLVRWMAEIAEEAGVMILPGIAGTEILFGAGGRTVVGVRTGDKGLGKDGRPKANFEPGPDLMAPVTVIGEGARGNLMAQIARTLPIRQDRMPEVFELGIKEVIRLPEPGVLANRPYNVLHTFGHPLDRHTAGGGFLYEMAGDRVALGFLVGLGYRNPDFDPYEAFMRFKAHPLVAEIIRGGEVVEQGARTVSSGGWYTLPQLSVDGALFVGNAAAMMNLPALKGIHLAMASGMAAAEAAMTAVTGKDASRNSLSAYDRAVLEGPIGAEMRSGRNWPQAMAKSAPTRFIHLGAQYVSGGRGLVDPMPVHADHLTLGPKKPATVRANVPVAYDDRLMVDRLTGVYRSKTMHREDQPSHLRIHDPALCAEICWPTFGAPCTRFCPGQVYAMDTDGSKPRLKLTPSNCLHCKTCDIKDPYRNIQWACPEGGDGPGYQTT